MILALLIPFLLVFGLVVVANKVDLSDDPRAMSRFTRILAAANIPLLFAGVALLFVPYDRLAPLIDAGTTPENVRALSVAIIGVGLWGLVSCAEPFRRVLARFIPLDSDSAVHLTALVLAGYLVANTTLTVSQDLLAQLSAEDLRVSVGEVVLQQAAFAALAFIGAGLFVRRDPSQTAVRLGLTVPSIQELMIGLGVIVLLIMIQGMVGATWALLQPEQAAELTTQNEALLAEFNNVGAWLVLALSSGIGEETLFRGALQPVFGLPLTSVLFAITHIQYGLSPITLAVFLLGAILGLVRRYTSTTVAIFVHFGYNFSLGLLTMLALYLEQFVTP